MLSLEDNTFVDKKLTLFEERVTSSKSSSENCKLDDIENKNILQNTH